MNNIVVLAGGRNSGKSSILRSLCSLEVGKNLKKSLQELCIDFGSKRVMIFIFSSSPQEINEFCHINDVINTIKKDIGKSEEKAKKMGITEFIIIEAFTLQVNKQGQYGYDCITKPLDFLDKLPNYKLYLIHIERNKTKYDKETNRFLKTLNTKETLTSQETSNKRQDANAIKLKSFLKSII